MMNQLDKRFLLFLIGCIGTRTAFALIAKNISMSWLPSLGYLALLPVIGWLYIIITNSRQTGAEVFGERIWWGNLRIIHAALYTGFAIMAIKKQRDAWMFLGADVLLGLSAFLLHHWSKGNFQRL